LRETGPHIFHGADSCCLFGAAFFNSGQVCAIIKRLYVHDDIYDAVCDELAALANHRQGVFPPRADAA